MKKRKGNEMFIRNVTKLLFTFVILTTALFSQTPEEEFTFVFMTDIHLQPERGAVEGFDLAIQRVNELNPDFVITGGDLIMDALGQSYGRSDSLYNMFIEQSKKFNMPVYNTMGNHEVFGLYVDSGIDPTHEEYNEVMYENRIGKRYYSFDHKGWHFMILDAIGQTEERRYIGEIDEEQINWIKKDLEQLDKGTPIVISVHIPFVTIQTQLSKGTTEPNSKGTVITNGKEVLELFKEHNLTLTLQGHLHILEYIYLNGYSFLTGGAVSARWWQGPNYGLEEGFVLVKVKGSEFDWEYIDYGWNAVVEK
jgi:predicted MPP superfamily phosphohydrolase